MNWLAFIAGLGAGMGVLVLALVGILGWVLTQTPERVEKIKQTGSAEEPVARVRAAPLEPEERARNAMIEDAVEVGAKNLMALAEENGRPLTLKDARERARELVEKVYADNT